MLLDHTWISSCPPKAGSSHFPSGPCLTAAYCDTAGILLLLGQLAALLACSSLPCLQAAPSLPQILWNILFYQEALGVNKLSVTELTLGSLFREAAADIWICAACMKPQCMHEGSCRMGNEEGRLLTIEKVSGGGGGVCEEGVSTGPREVMLTRMEGLPK